MMRARTLRAKIQLFAAVIACGIGLAVFLVYSIMGGQEVRSTLAREVRDSGNVAKSVMLARFRSLQEKAQFAAKSIEAGGFANHKEIEGANGFAGRCRKVMHATSVVISDVDGRVLGSSIGGVQPNRSGALKGFDRAKDGRIACGLTYSGKELGVGVAVPIMSDRKVVGVLQAIVPMDYVIGPDLRDALSSDIVFVNGNNVLGASVGAPSASIPAPLEPRVITVGGSRYMGLFVPLGEVGASEDVGFVVLRDYDDMDASYGRVTQVTVGLAAVLLLIGWLGSHRLARHVSEPLEQMVDAAIALRRGEWPQPFNTEREDEIGVMQRVFDNMIEGLRDSQARLLAMVDQDPLTELDNHRKFKEKLYQAAETAVRRNKPLSVLLVDVDDFESFNQRYGHAEGDKVLAGVAGMLRELCTDSVSVSRFAGEEFAVLMWGGLDEAEQAGTSVCELLRVMGSERGLTVSVGCAEMADDCRTDSLLLAAELALSRAKQLGKDRVCRFDNVPGSGEVNPVDLQRYLADGSLATVQALAAAVDAKDNYTNGHSIRVAEYAAQLARRLGCTNDMAELVYRTGTLHDVGKIGVPDHILKKEGPLTEEERSTMETHPVLGEIIVRKVPALEDTLPGVRHHHERWDGKGYPDHIAGEDIPWVARVLAVADTFDAMNSDRPYRKGLSIDIALSEIEKSAGTQFDPVMAVTFVEMMRGTRQEAA